MKSLLKNIRKSLKLTQEELAAKTSRSQACISAYENNSRSMDVNFAFDVIELAKNMGVNCTINDFYERD